jgi:hypothetical protein
VDALKTTRIYLDERRCKGLTTSNILVDMFRVYQSIYPRNDWLMSWRTTGHRVVRRRLVDIDKPAWELLPSAQSKGFTLTSHCTIWKGGGWNRCTSNLASHMQRLIAEIMTFRNCRQNLNNKQQFPIGMANLTMQYNIWIAQGEIERANHIQ